MLNIIRRSSAVTVVANRFTLARRVIARTICASSSSSYHHRSIISSSLLPSSSISSSLPLSSLPPRRFFTSPPGALNAVICTQPKPSGEEGTIPVVLVGDAKKIWSDFDKIIDVREKDEVDAEGMIPGAIHVPLATLLSNPDAEILQGKQVLVYCRGGIRSARAVEAMQNVGIDAINLGGGYLAWQGDM